MLFDWMMMTLVSSEHNLLTLSDVDFNRIAELVYSRFGIFLSEKKKALVRGRLQKLVRDKGFESFSEYFDELERRGSAIDLLHLIDRISTNHSFFFREDEHFDYLTKEVLPQFSIDDIRIWSAGGAAGQEAYTLAMVLREYYKQIPNSNLPCILATDISVSALEQAQTGVYPEEILSSVPRLYRKYFQPCDSGKVLISPLLREMITFKRLNLKQEVFPFKGKFHIIFCRNVMIYFDKPTKLDLVARFSRYTRSGGYLFIGHSESLGRQIEDYSYIKPTVYRKWVQR
jgi:chemotaxis protein methyltransferase CheR